MSYSGKRAIQPALTLGPVALEIPSIPKLPPTTPRCPWSVMIPSFNTPSRYLRQALESVLQQDPGPEVMQIKVVDDASTEGDSETVVREVGRGRVEFERNEGNLGQARNLNRCITLARGTLVHLLHADDYVMPGFYPAMAAAARQHPAAGWFACRSLFVNDEGVATGETRRIPEMASPGSDVSAFFYGNPVQTPSVVVPRESYEVAGGFSPSLIYLVDLEAWVRIISTRSGVAVPSTVASYRVHPANVSSRALRDGTAVREAIMLNGIFAERFQEFSVALGRRHVAKMAWNQYLRFLGEGSRAAARVNHRLWVENAPRWLRFRYAIKFWTAIRWKMLAKGASKRRMAN